MFRAIVVSVVAALASANIVPDSNIPATSRLGQSLLNKATVVKHARHLDQQERDVTFIAKYSLRYLGCSDLVQVNPEGQGGDEGMLYTQHLVRFALCPSGCGSCSGGGEYVVSMMEFVDLYTEAKLNEKEYKCEMIRENCYCENANDDEACENQCYVNAGMSDCIEYEGQEEFEIQRYLECQEMEGGNNNNNNNNNNNGQNQNQNQNGNWQNGYYGALYVGPYCSPEDGSSILLGVFQDEQCTVRGDNSFWSQRNYGQTLPFSTQSIVSTSDCISCEEVDQDANNNNNYQQQNGNNNYYQQQQDLQVAELCEQTYEMAARCEENMEIMYKDTSGCTYINDILPRLESASRSLNVGDVTTSTAMKVFVGVFAFTTVLFAAYSYFLYRKIKRGSVNLASQE